MPWAGNDLEPEGSQSSELSPVEASSSGLLGNPERRLEDSDDPVIVAAAFVAAVAWGEHVLVWDMFTSEARRAVLGVAVARGMDERLSARLRDGTATSAERDIFLADLVNGLRADLRGSDLDGLDYQPDPDPRQPDPDRTRIMLMAPMINPLLGAPLPVASLELVRHEGRWRVEHLLPRAPA